MTSDFTKPVLHKSPVQVGTSHQEQRIVGYITCTHLHAIEGDASVRCEQLDLLLQWGTEFRRITSQSAGQEKGMEDQVAFDVILGDLNFDNCSSEDKLEQQHAIFTQYRDPCRLGPGEDKPWALARRANLVVPRAPLAPQMVCEMIWQEEPVETLPSQHAPQTDESLNGGSSGGSVARVQSL
ncbi:sphingomyelin phosphodiesterase 3 [Tachysurus ichikawai]